MHLDRRKHRIEPSVTTIFSNPTSKPVNNSGSSSSPELKIVAPVCAVVTSALLLVAVVFCIKRKFRKRGGFLRFGHKARDIVSPFPMISDAWRETKAVENSITVTADQGKNPPTAPHAVFFLGTSH